ncbi:hypothetical protein [Caldivirga maquilingensis]|uniref:Uncharacterized protein n=1 Tax=Caldivirga maquilingensis (strain ATCC 700844 / DSM 13496 / JCM 10307 / IC-167) TaxID=397948 RepID=A8MAC5_CALMQ|nr:hypothetical protein [Caldivirga maquilingensis]ABW02502.1 hypothetical protein Cmaq_1679 [Caldivirga maquilingensis IC-167]
MSQSQNSPIPEAIINILYWGGIITVLAIAYTIDYLLIHLWLYGNAEFNIVLDALILASLLSFDALSLASTIFFIKNARSRTSSWLLLIYAVGAFAVLTYYTYIVMASHTAIMVEVYGQGVTGDKYIGSGIVLYNMGMALMTWLIIQGRGNLSKLTRAIPMLPVSQSFTNRKRSNDANDPIIICYDDECDTNQKP